MLGSVSNHDLIVRAQSQGLPRVQAEVKGLYTQAQLNVRGLSTDMQRFGHHSFTALAIFKGLAIYRGFGFLTQSIAQGAQAAIDFQYAMAQVNSLMQVSDTQLRQYSDTLIEFSKKMPLTLQQLAEGMYDIVSAGYTGVQSLTILTKASKAAIAGATDLRSASQAGIATMNAFGKSIEDLDHIFNVHFESVKMGIFTYEQLNQVLGRVTAAASLAGQSMETAFAALVAVSRAGFGGVAFAEGATRVVRFFQELTDASVQQKIQALGIATEDSFGKMRNAIDIVAELQGKLATMTDSAQAALTNQLFTNERSVQGFRVLANMLDTWREAEMKGIFSLNAMPTAFEKMQDAVKNTMTIIQNQFTASMTTLTANLSPLLKGVSTLFENLSRAIIPFGIVLSSVAAKYIQVAISSKILERQHLAQAFASRIESAEVAKLTLEYKLEMAQIEYNVAMRTKYNGVLGSTILNMHYSRNALAAEKRQWYENNLVIVKHVVAKEHAVLATQGEISANNQLIISLKKEELQHRQTTLAKYGSTFAGIAMIGSMIGMASGSKVLTAAMFGLQTFLMSFQIILPIITGMHAALAAAQIAGAGAAGIFASAMGVARAMLGDVTVLASLAIAGTVAATVAILTLNSGIGEVTETANEYTDAISQMESETQTLEESVKTLVDKLVEEGQTLGFITQQVKDLVEASHGIGPEMIKGLATQRFAMAGNTAIVAPVFAQNEKGEYTKEATQALLTIGVSPDSKDAILDVQAILKDMVRSADEGTKTIGETLTRNIFGGFGDSLISLWSDYDQELTVVDASHKKLFEEAQAYVDRFAASTRKKYENMLADMTPEELGKTLNIPYNVQTQELEPQAGKSVLEQLLGQTLNIDEVKQKWIDAAVNADETLNDLKKVGENWYSIGEIWKGAGYTMANISTTIGQTVTDTMKGLSDVMNLDDVVQAMIDHAGALDEAGIHWEGVADNWDKLGEDWAVIQRKWQALQLIETFMNVTKSLSDIPTQILSQQAISAQQTLAGPVGQFLEQQQQNQMTPLNKILWALQHPFAPLPAQSYDELANQAQETTVLINADELTTLQQSIYTGIYPVLLELLPQLILGGGGSAGIMGVFQSILDAGNIWDIIGGTADNMEETVEDIADAFYQNISDTMGAFSEGIDLFVQYGTKLDEAGYLWKGVAGQWEQLGDEWATIQRMFNATGIINNLIQATNAMDEYGVDLGAGWQDMMYGLLHSIGSSMLPLLQDIFDNLPISDPGFWTTLFQDIPATVEEMAADFMDMLHGASGFSNAIDEFVKQSFLLEDAGFYFRQVAGGWDQLGTEWARIQAQFKVVEMVNSFRMAASAMTDFGIELPTGFEDSMFQLMQLLATSVLPDFQGVIDDLMGNIGSADFWDALARGMAEADIRQSNSIVLAPYIVISEGMDNEAILDLVNQALIDEAKRNGFSWTG